MPKLARCCSCRGFLGEADTRCPHCGATDECAGPGRALRAAALGGAMLLVSCGAAYGPSPFRDQPDLSPPATSDMAPDDMAPRDMAAADMAPDIANAGDMSTPVAAYGPPPDLSGHDAK